MATMSHYQIDRSTTIDHSGTTVRQVFITSSRQQLAAAIEETIRRPEGAFTDDLLDAAIEDTIDGGWNALAGFFPAFLVILEGDQASFWRDLLPDLTIRRGAARLTVEVQQDELLEANRRNESREYLHARLVCPGVDRAARFTSLDALGAAVELLGPLRDPREEDLQVETDSTALLRTIPELEGPKLTAPLRFRPFFEDEAFQQFWARSREDLSTDLPAGGLDLRAWDGLVPLDRWFPLRSITAKFEDDTSVFSRWW